jgi:hypothetical protein
MFGSGVNISPQSELGKELAKWNKPYKYEEFPRMLYRARRRPDGVVRSDEVDDKFFGDKLGAAELWSKGNQVIVKNEDEYLKAKGQGWSDSPADAIELFKHEQDEVATQAAHRAHDDRNMGEQAKAEANAAESAESFEHVPEIAEKPKKRKYTRRQAA